MRLILGAGHLTSEDQDALCCLATGGTYAARALYTNNQEVVVNIKRPVIMNGIGSLVTAQDLLERSLYFELPIIGEADRQGERELINRFEAQQAVILGGLLNTMAKALAAIPHIPLNNLPRMADFAQLGRAVAYTMGLECSEFDRQYADNQRRALEKGLDACAIYPALVSMLKDSPQGF